MKSNDIEEWKTITDFPKYQISSFGRVKSFHQSKLGKIRKLANHRQGYIEVILKSNSSKGKVFKVHRLVALHFISNPKNKSEVNHKDGNKRNNHIDNLIWATRNENQQHAFNTGLQIGLKGELNPASKLTNKDIINIRSSNLKQIDLIKLYGLGKSAIQNIRHKKSWKHIV